jgi:catechol 2,3-dioxygenase-like lactoylglutathione lyase family enzyme|tara:strand:+ start:695 stop:1069 length:375 start_codon:yes stop_codon:yes gene_type:complete
MKVTKISAVTLPVSDMKKSVDFYSKIPNFKIVYGGSDSGFTSFLIEDTTKSYLNLKLNEACTPNFGRIIFYVDNVDDLFAYMESDEIISGLGKLESKPEDATWGERFFHALDPDGYKLSFATPI